MAAAGRPGRRPALRRPQPGYRKRRRLGAPPSRAGSRSWLACWTPSSELGLLEQAEREQAVTEIGDGVRCRAELAERGQQGRRRHPRPERVLVTVGVRDDRLPLRADEERQELLRRGLVLARSQYPRTGDVQHIAAVAG